MRFPQGLLPSVSCAQKEKRVQEFSLHVWKQGEMHSEAEIQITAGQSLAPCPPNNASKPAVKATHSPLRNSWTASVPCRCKQADFLTKDLWHHIYPLFLHQCLYLFSLLINCFSLWEGKTISASHYLMPFTSEMFSWIQGICFLLGCQGKNPYTINVKCKG